MTPDIIIMLAKTAKGSIKKLTDLVCWCAPKFCVRREEIVMQIWPDIFRSRMAVPLDGRFLCEVAAFALKQTSRRTLNIPLTRCL